MTTTNKNRKTLTLLENRQITELVFPMKLGSIHEKGEGAIAAMAQRWDLPIRMVHASNSVDATDPDLESFADRFRHRYPEIQVTTKHMYGDNPSKAIAEAVLASSLLFLTTEHADEWKVKGSVAESLLHQSGVPMLIFGPNAAAINAEGDVVIGLDGSASAEFALPVANGMAQALGTRLWLVRVVPVSQPSGVTSDHIAIVRYLESKAQEWSGSGNTGWEIIKSNDPVDALEYFANSRTAAAIVASARDRTNPVRKTMGSITMGLVANAKRPILTVEAPETPALN